MYEKKIADLSNENFSKFAFESSQARLERIIKWLCIIIAILIIALVGSNAWWIHYENSFVDTVTTSQTVEQDNSDGGTNYVGDFIGGDYNGEAESDKNSN